MDDERSSLPIWVLAMVVGMVPVSAWLVDLGIPSALYHLLRGRNGLR